MAATAGRLLRVQTNFGYFINSAYSTHQSVKPHVPLIRFPQRGATASGNAPAAAGTSQPSAQKSSSDSKSIGKAPRGSGIDYWDLPLRYQRRDIDSYEMECIEKGGLV